MTSGAKAVVAIFASATAGCVGAPHAAAPLLPAFSRPAGVITLTPSALAIPGFGAANAKTAVVGDLRYTGKFTETGTCKSVATVKPGRGKGPLFTVTVTGVGRGACTIAFADAARHSAKLRIVVLGSVRF